MPPFNPDDPFSTIPIETSAILINLSVSLACGLAISLFYRWSYRGTSYSATYVASLVSLALITTIVMMAIGNNLARAFGLVGAMSIIRFRTAVKDTQDLAFIFLSLASGLAVGVGFLRLAVLGTAFAGGTLWALGRSGYGASRKLEYLIELEIDDQSEEDAPWVPVLNRLTRHHRLLHARSREGGSLELAFLVHLRTSSDAPSLTRALRAVPGVEHVTLYFDEDRPL